MSLEYSYEFRGSGEGGSNEPGFYKVFLNGKKIATDSHGNPIQNIEKASTGTKKNRIQPIEIKEISKETYKKYEEERKIVEDTKGYTSALNDGIIVEGNIRIGMSPAYRKAHGFSENSEKRKIEAMPIRNIQNSYTNRKQLEKISNYSGAITQICERFGIPEAVFIQLLSKENGTFNPKAESVAGAYGIGQMLPRTWSSMEKKVFEMGISHHRYLDKNNPTNQILLAGAYFDFVRGEKGCDWAEAMVYYHTGPNIAKFNLGKAMANNPGIARRMEVHSKEGYIQAAAKYYNTARFGTHPNNIHV